MFHAACKFSQYLIVPVIEHITAIPRPQDHTGNVMDRKYKVLTEPSSPPETAAFHDNMGSRCKAAMYGKVRRRIYSRKFFREQVV